MDSDQQSHHHQQRQQHAAGATMNGMHSFTSATADSTNRSELKRKRGLPGNPDPDAEVIALSPRTLMATNRFICEICNKGFQRDQNLQLHRRGHNLPWKLRQRSKEEVVRKKVYVCPEESCVHHDPSRALGDLTGIKKHFFRKHGEKRWKCDKCSKKYAVMSDWKAHNKICGTKEYKCDCGAIFSRKDSFVTHRAFCDALADESAKAAVIAQNNQSEKDGHYQTPSLSSHPTALPKDHEPELIINTFVEAEQQQQEQDGPTKTEMALLAGYGQQAGIFSNVRLNVGSGFMPAAVAKLRNASTTVSSPHLSATALLQKAAQIGATTGACSQYSQLLASHTTEGNITSASKTELSGLGLVRPFPQETTLRCDIYGSFEEAIDSGGRLGGFSARSRGNSAGNGAGGDGFTRDFLGLRPLSHTSLLSSATLDSCMQLSNGYAQLQTEQSINEHWHG